MKRKYEGVIILKEKIRNLYDATSAFAINFQAAFFTLFYKVKNAAWKFTGYNDDVIIQRVNYQRGNPMTYQERRIPAI